MWSNRVDNSQGELGAKDLKAVFHAKNQYDDDGQAMNNDSVSETAAFSSKAESVRPADKVVSVEAMLRQGIMRDTMGKHISTIFHGVFAYGCHGVSHLVYEISNNHPFFSLVFDRRATIANRAVKGLKISTNLLIAVLGIYLLYSFFYEDNDLSCFAELTELSCLSKSGNILDGSATCEWLNGNFCAYMSSYNKYSYYSMTIIVLIVSFAMAPISYVVDLMCDVILLSPIQSEGNPAEDKAKLARKLDEKVALSLTRLRADVEYHRFKLLHSHRSDLLQLFDENFGIVVNRNSTLSIDHIDRIDGIDSFDFLHVDAIAHDIRRLCRLDGRVTDYFSSFSASEKGLFLLYEFVVDLLGRSTPLAKIFVKKNRVAYCSVDFAYTLGTKIVTGALLMLVNVTCLLLYIYLFAGRTYYWFVAVVYAVYFYICVDFLLLEPAKQAWAHYIIPSFIRGYVKQAEEVLCACVGKVVADGIKDTLAADKFSASDHLFLSVRAARLSAATQPIDSDETSLEAAVICAYRSSYPLFAGLHWGASRDVYYETFYGRLRRAYERVKITSIASLKGRISKIPLDSSPDAKDEVAVTRKNRLARWKDRLKKSRQKLRCDIEWLLVAYGAHYSISAQKMITHFVHVPLVAGTVMGIYQAIDHINTYGIFFLVATGFCLVGSVAYFVRLLTEKKIAPELKIAQSARRKARKPIVQTTSSNSVAAEPLVIDDSHPDYFAYCRSNVMRKKEASERGAQMEDFHKQLRDLKSAEHKLIHKATKEEKVNYTKSYHNFLRESGSNREVVLQKYIRDIEHGAVQLSREETRQSAMREWEIMAQLGLGDVAEAKNDYARNSFVPNVDSAGSSPDYDNKFSRDYDANLEPEDTNAAWGADDDAMSNLQQEAESSFEDFMLRDLRDSAYGADLNQTYPPYEYNAPFGNQASTLQFPHYNAYEDM